MGKEKSIGALILIVVGVLVLIGGLTIGVGSIGLSFKWEYTEEERQTSPSGEFDAVVLRGNAGAVSGYQFEIYVVLKGVVVDRERDRRHEVYGSYENAGPFHYEWKGPDLFITVEETPIDHFWPFYFVEDQGGKRQRRGRVYISFRREEAEAEGATLPHGEEIEFRFEPSFQDGTHIWVARFPDGSVHCLAYSLPITSHGGVASHGRPETIKEVSVASDLFDQLVSTLEGEELRHAAEISVSSGIDGAMLIFRRKAGARSIEFRFWTPDANSPASRLADSFFAAAQLPKRFGSQKEVNQRVDPRHPED